MSRSNKDRYQDRLEGAKLLHEGRKLAEASRKRLRVDNKSERARILRLGRSAADKLVRGSMKLNKGKQE